MRNFTVTDTLGILKSCLALFPFMFVPGYVAGWLLDLFEFRRRRPILPLILAVPLSIAICPMISYLFARFLEPGLWVFYFAAFGAWTLLLTKKIRRARMRPLSKCTWAAMALIALWGIAALGSLVDIQFGDKLYPPIVAYDHSRRAAITVGVAHHIPPSNPFLAHAAGTLRYHYLWLLFCSLPMKLVPLSPRCAVYSGVIWCGVGLICLVALGFKFLETAQGDIERKSLLGAALLCATGLDILPTLYIRFAGKVVLADMELWNESQITSWVGSVLWVPHHVAALIACFVAFLLLRHQAEARRWSTAPVIVAGMAFASAAGMSVYVTFAFVVAVALWLLASITRKDWLEVLMFVGAGTVALLWALPFLLSLNAPTHSVAFAELALRPFSLAVHFSRKLGFSPQTPFELTLINLVFLPLNYALELGFFLAVGVLRLREIVRHRIQASANELASWTLAATSFLIGTFLRSSFAGTNDLGWRCFLPAQLILLLWSATLVQNWWLQRSRVQSGAATDVRPGVVSQFAPPRWTHATLATLLILGLLGTMYQVIMLRIFPVLLDHGLTSGVSWLSPDPGLGERVYSLRSAYAVLDAELPPSAVLQSNPRSKDLILHMLYSGHDAAVGNGDCGTDYGGDPSVCALRVKKLAGLFEFHDGSDLEATCREYGIDAIVVENTDPVWRDPESWIRKEPPVFANDYVRAFRCGQAAAGAHRVAEVTGISEPPL